MFPFDSNRKRHSVIVKENDTYKLYIKGADTSMVPIRSEYFEHPYIVKTQKALDDFAGVGLRTLVLGCRILSKKQYKELQKMYQELLVSADRKKKLEVLTDLVEDNIAFLGCTAIRDHLQEKVPEVITRFTEAGVRVWMITGDKVQTAESIAQSAGIFNPSTEVFKFAECHKSEFKKQVIRLKRNIQKAVTGGAKRIGIVVDVSQLSSHFI